MKLSETQLEQLKNDLIAWMQERLQAVHATNAVVGISGGKDSATVAALCVAAYGKEHVYGVLMPDGDQSDIDYAKDLCVALDMPHEVINIQEGILRGVGGLLVLRCGEPSNAAQSAAARAHDVALCGGAEPGCSGREYVEPVGRLGWLCDDLRRYSRRFFATGDADDRRSHSAGARART